MLFNDHVLFIHAPKTAGMSITSFLKDNLSGVVTVSAPEGHEQENEKVRTMLGLRHEWLHKAEELLIPIGRKLDSFDRIVSVIRNPYDLEVSRYHYLRLGHPYDKGHAQRLALEGKFEQFSEEAPYVGKNPSNIQAWYVLGNKLLSNMRIVRFEGLEQGLRSAIGDYLPKNWSLPKINQTKHEDYREYLSVKSEAAIYRKYQWIFDSGYYSRDSIANI